ncbi:MAG: methionine adenosyltransferase domain-containing protein [Minisyncoccia bacterium]
MNTKIRTAEFVSPRHPDKMCDLIADTLLDAFLAGDKKSRVAAEVMGGHGHITVSGEITSRTDVDMEKIVKGVVGEEYNVHVYLTKQSPEIAQGVDTGGAGDQGIMMGYATREAENFMPLEYELARDLCRKIYAKYPHDGKTQVTVEGTKVRTVVASFQGTKTPELMALVRGLIKADEYLVNPAGEWMMGGFDADSGISGRKIVIDNYGPEVGVGGGSFSGKDYTKVDRSGAYMARRIAVDYLKQHADVETVRVKLAYAIGKAEPVMAVLDADGVEVAIQGYDLSPAGIFKFLELDKVRWAETSSWGHFGREFSWG